MSTVSFYLKASKEEKALIYLQYKYAGKRLVYSFGQHVEPKNWNYKKQRVKNNKTTTNDGKHLLNDLLDNLKKVCETAYNTEIKNGVPNPDTLRQYLIDFMNQNEESQNDDKPTLYKLIDRFESGEITRDGKEKSKGSINNYRTVKLHLQAFEKRHKYKIDFDTITLNFFYKYTKFLREEFHPKNKPEDFLKPNSIAKDISIIKVFMGEAVDLDYTDNLQFRNKKFSFSEVDVDAVYLTDQEIQKLYRYELTNKKLEHARDLFVFGCYVGLRYSDYSDIKPENIVLIDGEYFIKTITKKTKEPAIVPCSPIVLEIFKKYDSNPNKLPVAYSEQKFNEYIKDVCRIAGLTEKGRLGDDLNKELCDCISSHTCRRSFCTNLYLEGFPVIEIMKVSTHRTEKAFMKYIRVSKLDAAKRLKTHMTNMWSRKILKAVV